jgi:hypothetical protein
MKNKLLLIAFSFVSLVTMAQSYSISPSNTLHESAVYNEENKFKMFFTNISNASINLEWKVIGNNLVAGWDCYICDNVSCCKGVPQNGKISYLDPGIDVFLALVVNPKAIPGNGTLKIYIYEDIDPSKGDTLTWVVNSIATGINTLEGNSGVTVFPNPAADYVMIDMNAYHSLSLNTIAVYNSTGQLLMERKINNAIEKLDITNLPKGSSYQIILSDGKRNRIVKTVIK